MCNNLLAKNEENLKAIRKSEKRITCHNQECIRVQTARKGSERTVSPLQVM